MACVIDVQAVDLRERGGTDADLHNAPSDRVEKSFALEPGEDLRVVDLADEPRVRRNETRGRDDGTRESRHADFIDADHTQKPLRP